MKKLYIYFLMCFFLLQIALADIVINEIMYNPEGNDNNKEFIEIYSGNYVNLSNLIIADSASNDSLVEVQYLDSGYSLIVEEGFDYSGINASVYSVGATIGNNLGNTEDNITLFYSNGTVIDFINYFSSWGADGDCYTLEKINPTGANSQENWGASLVVNGTPGYQNSIYGTGEIDYSQIEITEFLPDPEGNDDNPMPEGEWIELYNPTNAAMDLKWMFFKDLFGHTLYITDTTVTDTTIIPRNGYLVVYTNGKSGFLNNEGQEALEFYDKSGELIKNISYIDPVEGNSYAYVEGSGWQHTKPTPNEENVDNSTGKESSIEIEKIYDLGSDKIAKFGQTIRVKVHVYKGDTTKNSIALYVENKNDRINKQSKTSVYTRYTDYTLVIPIQLKPNCNEEFDDDDYYVYIRGLDKEDKKKIEVEDITDSLCEAVKATSSSTRSKLSYEPVSLPNEIENNNEIVSEIELSNDGDEDISLELWSYVYRGSKSYSGEREGNKIEIGVPAHSERNVKLYNTVSDAEPGDYKLKTKIKQTNQKTAKEITNDIEVVALKQAIKNNPGSGDINTFTKNRGVIYESSTIKAAKIVPYLIIILTTLLCIILIWKR